MEALLKNLDLPLRATFYPLGYAVEILTNDSAVFAAANASFGHMDARHPGVPLQVRICVSEGGQEEWPPEPARRQHDHLFSLVADPFNQALLDLKTLENCIWVQSATVHHQLYFRFHILEKAMYTLLSVSVVSDLHAACVSKGGYGLLLCGDSGAGKSTLSYACARSGWTYTSDDTSYLIYDCPFPRVVGHSHRVRFRPETKAIFPELDGRSLTRRLEGKPSIEIPTAELPGMITSSETNVEAVIYLNRNWTGLAVLDRLPDGTAMRRAQEGIYTNGEIREKQLKAFQALKDTPAYELKYCDLQSAIGQLDSLCEGSLFHSM